MNKFIITIKTSVFNVDGEIIHRARAKVKDLNIRVDTQDTTKRRAIIRALKELAQRAQS